MKAHGFVALAVVFSLALPLALSGCGQGENRAPSTGNALEDAALDAALVNDPQNALLTGLYERPSDLGTDRFCAVPTADAAPGSGRYRAGLLTISGADSYCLGRGTARHEGGAIAITLTGKSGAECSFSARFDGEQIAIPGALPDDCKAICEGRASFSGVALSLAIGGEAGVKGVATAPDGDPLCPQ